MPANGGPAPTSPCYEGQSVPPDPQKWKHVQGALFPLRPHYYSNVKCSTRLTDEGETSESLLKTHHLYFAHTCICKKNSLTKITFH